MKIKHIFFDLDRTLWDFEKNSKITLTEIIDILDLTSKGVDSAENFISKYRIHNERLWDLYRDNKITKEILRSERFLLTLQEYNIFDTKLADTFGNEYIKRSPLKTALFPFTLEVLTYLFKSYNLHIITNGFQEVQHVKLSNSNIGEYFNLVLTSEEAGVKKPDIAIFNYALNKVKAKNYESIMIGDDLYADIQGASRAGIKGIYFNPEKIKHSENVWQEIGCLSELMNLL